MRMLFEGEAERRTEAEVGGVRSEAGMGYHTGVAAGVEGDAHDELLPDRWSCLLEHGHR